MRGIFIRKGSPYYWLRYYDKFEPNKSKKRKEHNTKIEVTQADKKKYLERVGNEIIALQGTPELWRKVKELRQALADRDFQKNTSSKIIHKLKLSEGFEEFRKYKSTPGIKGGLKQKTLENYTIAVEHMKNACKDKYIYNYSADKDYIALLNYFEEKELSVNSRSIYTRSLKTLWGYFVEKDYTRINIIEPVEGEDKDPDPIPLEDMHQIIGYLQQDLKQPHHYWIIYFMLLTGCRPSSAMVQLKEDINFKKKYIDIQNVKTGKTKRKLSYRFPLYNELRELIVSMGVKEGDTGRLFDMYSVVPLNYTWPLSFWKRTMKLLKSAKAISKEYSLKQIRPTFLSFLINVLKMDIYVVYKLADHASIKITDKNYINFNISRARKILDDIDIDTFLEEDL